MANFSVKNDRLIYGSDEVYGEEGIYPFYRYRFDNTPISNSGANGIVFLAEHSILKIRVAVKIWKSITKIDFEKAVLEARKNANRDLAGVVALAYDAGHIFQPVNSFYSIMEVAENGWTLKEWLMKRNKKYDALCRSDNSRKRDITFMTAPIAQSLYVASNVLLSISELHRRDVIHGDLHGGNLIIAIDDTIMPEKLSDGMGLPIGNLKIGEVTIIDIGTSEAVGTNKIIGTNRDIQKTLDLIRKILKPVFDYLGCGFRSIIKVDLPKNIADSSACSLDGNKIELRQLTGDLLRLVVFLNLILGNIFSRGARNVDFELDQEDLRDLHSTINKSSGFYLFDGIYEAHVSALRDLHVEKPGALIDWCKLWNALCNRNKMLDKYRLIEIKGGFEFQI
ncbi:MAG: hypothetical protein Q4E11_00075 [Corynebacterium sp.]|uniref:hypothetical protein n=1 Tax=Corynebacterium sp. TaxID=1720 RepID=UPI0026DBF6A5|nr:hypothetical protein [Corynebacterium sp.]MDO5028970.1 hypothetical protein [Corynebacterium sp.]